MIKSFLVFSIILLACAAVADDRWIGADRQTWEQTEYRKVVEDFAGNLVVTDDPQWEKRWLETPPRVITFSGSSEARVGERLWILIFYVNPLLTEDGNAHVKCDIQVVRPDETISVDLNDIDCYRGPQIGSPDNVRLAAPVLEFTGEEQDPIGDWVVKVRLKDTQRGVSMDLKTGFRLLSNDA